jgi:two-component system phosphate regulon sensor histidine kinase PhoR
MKSTRSYYLWITLWVVLLVALLLVVDGLDLLKHPIVNYLVLVLVGVPGISLIVRFFFIRFVASRIDPIYKTIHSYSMAQKLIREKIDKGNVVDDLNREVKVWVDNQSEEIRKLRQLEKYRKDFLGNVSHELKTPIFNIQGYILTLLDGGMEDTSINRLYLKRAERSTNRLINILEDLDSIARLESGEFTLKIEVFNLVRLAEEVIEYQEMPARQKNIKIGFYGNYNKAVKVKADRKRIMEVLGNLIGNSIMYGREGGKTTIGFTDTGENILVDITDNGIGIEESNLPRIFERFYRVDKSRSRESGGTGLGLSIVKHTIQAHKQTITVRSRVNQGTTFIFSLDKA